MYNLSKVNINVTKNEGCEVCDYLEGTPKLSRVIYLTAINSGWMLSSRIMKTRLTDSPSVQRGELIPYNVRVSQRVKGCEIKSIN